MRYDQIRDARLPWGYWLRLQSDPGSVAYIDEEGRSWPSVRDAFWGGRLRMSTVLQHQQDEQLEIVLAALAARDRDLRQPIEYGSDVYGGSDVFFRLHCYWLQSIGLIGGHERSSPFDCQTTPEGRAVVAMLLATRSPKLLGVPIGREAVRLMGIMPSTEPISDFECLAEVERAAGARLGNAFVRETVGRNFVIRLIRRDFDGIMPTARTVWSAGFPSEIARDRLYRWLVDRIDRWDDWGHQAFKSGAPALTARLLSLVAVGLVETSPTRSAAALPSP